MKNNLYSEYVSSLANDRANVPFLNSGNEDSSLFMKYFFLTAEKEIWMFVRDLNGAVSNNDYRKALEKYLQREHTKLHVLFEKQPSVTSLAVALLFKQEYKYKVTIKYLPTLVGLETEFEDSSVFKTRSIHHIAVADERMYRLEFDTNRYIAKANYGDKETAQKLKTVFESINARGRDFYFNIVAATSKELV